MDFDPGRFLALLSWFFAGLYLVQRYGNSKLVSPVTKYLSYLLLLTLGPIYFLLLLGIFVLQKSQDGKNDSLGSNQDRTGRPICWIIFSGGTRCTHALLCYGTDRDEHWTKSTVVQVVILRFFS